MSSLKFRLEQAQARSSSSNVLRALKLPILLLAVWLGVITFSSNAFASEHDPVKGKIIIIIDDLGYQRQSGFDWLSLPYPITYAIIPFTPYATELALAAKQENKEVIFTCTNASP